MTAGMRALEMVHANDPKVEIQKEVETYLGDVDPLGALVVVGIYVRPTKTAGGIILTDNTQGEDVYQGKIGLVLKVGPLAFTEDETHRFGEKTPKVGDWVLLRVGDTFPFVLGKRHCRMVEDVDIKAIIKRPDIVL